MFWSSCNKLEVWINPFGIDETIILWVERNNTIYVDKHLDPTKLWCWLDNLQVNPQAIYKYYTLKIQLSMFMHPNFKIHVIF